MDQLIPRVPHSSTVGCRFAGFTLELRSGALLRPDGATVALRPKAAEVLLYLVGKAGSVVAREDLLEAVWPGISVTDDSITQCVVEIRRALGEGAGLLRTLPKRGYLLDAEVARVDAPQQGTTSAELVAAEVRTSVGTPGHQRRSALAVLPFANLSGNPEQDYFAAGIMEELTTALSRVRWFSVVGRTSTLVYRGQIIDARRVGRELGVRYLLEGSVRQAAGRIRIACQLIEAETGYQIWAERFEGDLDGIFALQDRVAEAVAGAVEPSLERAEIERVRIKPTAHLTAYDLYLRSLPAFFSMTEEGCNEALVLLRQAIAQDPGFSLAKAQLVSCLTRRVEQGWAGPGDREEGVRLAHEVLGSNGADPLALVCVVYAYGLLARDTVGALDVAKRALKLNPNSALVQGAAGLTSAWACEPVLSAAYFRRAIELSPSDPDIAFWTAGLARAALMAGTPEEAVPLAQRAIHQMSACVPAHRLLIAALSCLGLRDEASAAVDHLRATVPSAAHVSAETFRRMYRNQGFAETLIQAWREAGMPE
jgi:TolB-like protein